MTGDHFGESGFSGTVRSHDGVDFARWDFEVQTFEDRRSVDGRLEVFDGEAHVFEKVYYLPKLPFQADFEVADFGSLREFEDIFKLNSLFKDNVVDFSRLLVLKMTMIRQIRAIPRRLALEIDLPDEAVTHEGLQAVINGRQRDGGHPLLGPIEDIGCRRVIALRQDDRQDLAALLGHTQALQFRREIRRIGVLLLRKRDHRRRETRSVFHSIKP